MPNLTRASQELFRRRPDKCFESLAALAEHCRTKQELSREIWVPPQGIGTQPVDTGRLMLTAGATGPPGPNEPPWGDGAYEMNDWSFSQLCRLAGVGKETVNRLSPATARDGLRGDAPAGPETPATV